MKKKFPKKCHIFTFSRRICQNNSIYNLVKVEANVSKCVRYLIFEEKKSILWYTWQKIENYIHAHENHTLIFYLDFYIVQT